MALEIKAYIVNAFTKDGFGGSPTGVVLDAIGLSEEAMQFIASNLPVSHTAFVFEAKKENVKVRFFTPSGEILNCGHGTIAAHYTRAIVDNYSESCMFMQEARDGLQQVEVIKKGKEFEVYLRQNEIQFTTTPSPTLDSLLNIFSLKPSDLAVKYPVITASPGSERFLLGLKSSELVNILRPDFDKLKNLCSATKSIGCFAYSIDKPNEWEATARMFAPLIGVNEDIINGNSSGCLGVYLALLSGRSDVNLLVNQGQKFNQNGIVRVKVKKAGEHSWATIGGSAKVQRQVILSV